MLNHDARVTINPWRRQTYLISDIRDTDLQMPEGVDESAV
jgi:hypothetical protein